MRSRSLSPDFLAVVLLIALWVLFFWRLFTPIEADQASLTQGDFSGQFVAFGGYQYSRFAVGEIPLWNPYNNGGLPFIADTQAAVFYPPRLITIALANLSGGWTYHALELEMTFHVLLYTLMMYALVRRMTASVFAGFVAAVVGGYGGYISGYPPLQLALLEAGIWLPLAVLGLWESTRFDRIRWLWLVLTGFALGLSWMAGHPQTSWFLTYLLIAYFAYRVYSQRYSWRIFALGTALFGLISVGVVAVQLFPGFEYLTRTSRSDLGFDAKGGGFPFQDIIQMIFPGVVSLWSPLYVGLSGLVLAIIAVWRRTADALFWFGVVIFALALSVGANGALFHSLYNILPGQRFFRGQERAAYLVAHSLAILAGMGAAYLTTADLSPISRRLRQGLAALFVFCAAVSTLMLLLWLYNREAYDAFLNPVMFSAIIAAALFFVLPNHRILLALLLVFELFSVNIDNSNYDPIPPQEQIKPSALLDIPLADQDVPFRVDGFRVLHDNYGSLYGLADIQGISPLFLTGPQQIIEHGLPDERAWELFSVRYVYSDWDALTVPGVVLAEGEDKFGAVKLHQLTAPRPFAHLLYQSLVVNSDEEARLMLADPNFDPRTTIILHKDPGFELSGEIPEGAGTTITTYEPEKFTVIADTSENAILSLAQVNYPGWYATIDGKPAEILRAYDGLSAVALPAGNHTVEWVFNPLSYRVGAILSLFTWAGLTILAGVLIFRRRRYANS